MGHTYWDLPFDDWRTSADLLAELRQHVYAVATNTDKQKAFYHRQRLHRGLLSYRQRPVQELRHFAINRGLISFPGDQHDRSQLVEKLTEADDHPKFHCFLDLPPELRVHIYER